MEPINGIRHGTYHPYNPTVAAMQHAITVMNYRVDRLENRLHGPPILQLAHPQVCLSGLPHNQQHMDHEPVRRPKQRNADRNNDPCWDCQKRKKKCTKKTRAICERCSSKGYSACRPRPVRATKPVGSPECSDSEKYSYMSQADVTFPSPLADHALNTCDKSDHKPKGADGTEKDMDIAERALINIKEEKSTLVIDRHVPCDTCQNAKFCKEAGNFCERCDSGGLPIHQMGPVNGLDVNPFSKSERSVSDQYSCMPQADAMFPNPPVDHNLNTYN